ncbi:MAG: hypothetical protein JSW61_01535 [Candidatus Thorarchaeota archaeon]|nr:MAG: hypothetical protein JSW61_01535 [Candidatus Thorarchaeota archaeon]
MEQMKQVRLLSKQSKDIERQLVAFYKTVGEMVDLNPRTTEVFAYLRIYDALTQDQLKQLTGFSLSTISSILRSFLQADIASRKMIPGTHKNLYRIKPERVTFVYTPFVEIIEDLERLDSYIEEKQIELQELRKKYPTEIEFLYRRLNSLRNYVEVQRRAIKKEKKHTFFQEDVSRIVPPYEMIEYSFDIYELEENLMDTMRYFKEDPIKNRMLGIFFTHRSLNQQTLTDISGFSRSTVSRLLSQLLDRGHISALPREGRKPRVYYQGSSSLSILSVVLNADKFIFSSASRFQEILATLQSERQSDRDSEDADFLKAKIKEIIGQIRKFKNDTKSMRQALHDLSKFVENNTRAKS